MITIMIVLSLLTISIESMEKNELSKETELGHGSPPISKKTDKIHTKKSIDPIKIKSSSQCYKGPFIKKVSFSKIIHKAPYWNPYYEHRDENTEHSPIIDAFFPRLQNNMLLNFVTIRQNGACSLYTQDFNKQKNKTEFSVAPEHRPMATVERILYNDTNNTLWIIFNARTPLTHEQESNQSVSIMNNPLCYYQELKIVEPKNNDITNLYKLYTILLGNKIFSYIDPHMRFFVSQSAHGYYLYAIYHSEKSIQHKRIYPAEGLSSEQSIKNIAFHPETDMCALLLFKKQKQHAKTEIDPHKYTIKLFNTKDLKDVWTKSLSIHNPGFFAFSTKGDALAHITSHPEKNYILSTYKIQNGKLKLNKQLETPHLENRIIKIQYTLDDKKIIAFESHKKNIIINAKNGQVSFDTTALEKLPLKPNLCDTKKRTSIDGNWKATIAPHEVTIFKKEND